MSAKSAVTGRSSSSASAACGVAAAGSPLRGQRRRQRHATVRAKARGTRQLGLAFRAAARRWRRDCPGRGLDGLCDVRRRLRLKLEQAASEPDDVASAQLDGLRDPLPVHPGAVHRVEVVDLDTVADHTDERVSSRDLRVVDHDVGGAAPEHDLRFDLQPTAAERALFDEERGHVAIVTRWPRESGFRSEGGTRRGGLEIPAANEIGQAAKRRLELRRPKTRFDNRLAERPTAVERAYETYNAGGLIRPGRCSPPSAVSRARSTTPARERSTRRTSAGRSRVISSSSRSPRGRQARHFR